MTAVKKLDWNAPDLVDLAFFLNEDTERVAKGEGEQIKERDRNIYTRLQDTDGSIFTDRDLVRWWLEKRRKMVAGTHHLPGQAYQETARLLFFGGFGIGVFTGSCAVFPFLAYSGASPVNVTSFFLVFVLVQVLLFFSQVVLLAWKGYKRSLLPESLFTSCLGKWLARGIKKILKENSTCIPASRPPLCAALFLWFGFAVVQLVALGFNAGVLGVTLIKVGVSDIAFGWQSTLQIQDATLANWVQLVALPWAWCVPDAIAYPAVEAIQGSRMILKEGLYHLATKDLVSWWPFLCFAVFTYGFLPRLLLLLFGLRRKNALIASQPTMALPAIIQLLRRMTTPLVTTAGVAPSGLPKNNVTGDTLEQPDTLKKKKDEDRKTSPEKQGAASATLNRVVVLVPDELFDAYPLQELARRHMPAQQEKEVSFVRFGVPGDESETLLPAEFTEKYGEAHNVFDVVVVQEAWQPPIEETEEMLRQLLKTVVKGSITLLLTGKPGKGLLLTPAREADIAIWNKKLAGMAGARFIISTLSP